MRKRLIHFLLVALLSLFTAATHAQTTVRGQLVDSETGEPLVGAAVMVEGTSQGSVTDIDGYFKQSVAPNATLLFKYVGYKEFKKKITQRGNSVELGTVKMEPEAVILKDVTITSSVAVARKTPVAMSAVPAAFIEEKLGAQEFPEILKSTPGVYATKKGGGYGDSELRMRGFKSENIAMMINGVPVNDMEWGGVYWSNWAGLSDMTRSMQTQRGLGASKVSVPSVGGSINIVTKSIDGEKGGNVSYALGNDGYNKILFSASTGLSKSGWAMNILGSKTWGNGYIQGTDFEGYNWFVNISKRFNDNHQLSLTAFGAPQSHNQRDKYDGLSIEGWQTYGKRYMNGDSPYKYNPTFGYGIGGERKNSVRNVYHKPQISLNHLWQINQKSSLSTVVYISLARGYAHKGQGYKKDENGVIYRNKWSGSYNGKLNDYFRHEDGTFAYDEIYEMNAASKNGSKMVMSKSKNSHNWYGLLSTYTTKIGENIDLYAGVDFRYYKGIHTNELTDFYGGEYFLDESRADVKAENNAAASNPAFPYQKLRIGDVVYRDYDGFTMSEGIFAQAEYNKDKLSAFIAGSLSNTSYWRYDRYYYDKQHAESDKVHFLGYTVKGGLNFNITEEHNVFANVGYISRAPFFSGGAFLQSTTSNATNPDAINEKVFSAEIGYGYRSRFVNTNLNIYHTQWLDKTMTRSLAIENQTTGTEIDRATINMSGVDATHQGIELDMSIKPLNWLELTGMFSIGNWRWASNPTGYFYNSQGQPLKDLNGTIASGILSEDHAYAQLMLDNVKVGGSAQTTAAAGVAVRVAKGLRVGADFTYQGRNYADWSINTNTLSANKEIKFYSPWKIPAAGIVDMNASYSFKFGKVNATLYGNVNNLLNQEYISDATVDATRESNWKNAYGVFYGFGRTYNVRLKLNF